MFYYRHRVTLGSSAIMVVRRKLLESLSPRLSRQFCECPSRHHWYLLKWTRNFSWFPTMQTAGMTRRPLQVSYGLLRFFSKKRHGHRTKYAGSGRLKRQTNKPAKPMLTPEDQTASTSTLSPFTFLVVAPLLALGITVYFKPELHAELRNALGISITAELQEDEQAS